jgi:hypothetical protein
MAGINARRLYLEGYYYIEPNGAKITLHFSRFFNSRNWAYHMRPFAFLTVTVTFKLFQTAAVIDGGESSRVGWWEQLYPVSVGYPSDNGVSSNCSCWVAVLCERIIHLYSALRCSKYQSS